MKGSDLIVVGAAAVLAGFVTVQLAALPGRAAPAWGAGTSTADSIAVAQYYYTNLRPVDPLVTPPRWLSDVHVARLRAAVARTETAQEGTRDDAAVRATLRADGAHGYIGAILADNDSVLARWPAAANPIRVWVQPRSSTPGFTPAFVSPVRASFLTWNDVGIGLGFALVDDSTQADVHVTWSQALPGLGQIGNTLRITDRDGWVVAAHVILATSYEISTVQNAALHEVGHVLGLDHSPNHDDLMAATTNGRQYRLTPADRNTARLLYSVPAGRVR